MTITYEMQRQVVVRFRVIDGDREVYNGAMVFTKDEYDSKSSDDIVALCQARYDEFAAAQAAADVELAQEEQG